MSGLLRSEDQPAFARASFADYPYPRAIDPQWAEVLRQQALAAPRPSRYAMPFEQARAALLEERRQAQTGTPVMAAIRDRKLLVDGRSVGLRWYEPMGAPSGRAGGATIAYLHGGGWCVGSNDTHDTALRHLAAASGLTVCGVDYSLAPEHPFPAALNDTRAVVDHLLDRAANPATGSLLLAGDSAGANLALVEAMRRRDAEDRGAAAKPWHSIAGLLLFYGVFGPLRDQGSCAAYGSGEFGLSCAAQRRYLGAYLGQTKPDWRVYPLAGRLDQLPPIWSLAAGLDPLLDDAVDLHHAVQAAGGQSVLRIAAGLPHGFLNHAHVLTLAQTALAQAGAFALACPRGLPRAA